MSPKSTDEMYLELRTRFEKREYVDAKAVLDDAISELMKAGRTREEAIFHLYFYETPEYEYELTENRGIPIIAVLNLLLYVLVLLSRTVIPFVFGLQAPNDAVYDPGGPWGVVFVFVSLGVFIYFIVGIVGSILVFKYKRNKLVYDLAMFWWALETIFFSLQALVSFLQLYLDEIIVGIFRMWFLFNFLLYLSVVVLKVASIAYFATKKVRSAYGYRVFKRMTS
ncbi:MAG: hypothetical protein PVH12_00355 [Candidatus Bathyarchaeota archaeon]